MLLVLGYWLIYTLQHVIKIKECLHVSTSICTESIVYTLIRNYWSGFLLLGVSNRVL